MYCPACGSPIAEAHVYCPSCGSPTGAAPVADPTTQWRSAGATPSAAFAFTKPSPLARLAALFIDSIIATSLLYPGIILQATAARTGEPNVLGIVLLLIGGLWEVAYLLGRDGFGGAGIGKRIAGLVVISETTGQPAGIGASAVRQLVLVATNAIPVVGSLIEPYFVVAEPHGRRWGDKVAKTRVVRAGEFATAVHRAPAGKSLAYGALAGFLLVSLVGSAAAGFVSWRTLSDGDAAVTSGTTDYGTNLPGATDPGNAGSTTPSDGGQAPPGETTTPGTASAVGPGAETPEGAVDAFYTALANGDDDALDAALSSASRSGTDVSTFPSWAAPGYTVLGTEEQGSGSWMVQVQEYDGGLANGLVTFYVVEEDGWRVDSWVLGDSTGVDTGSPSDTGTQFGLTPQSAEAAVSGMLDAMIADDMEAARSHATRNFQETEDGFFSPTTGAFLGYTIINVFPDGGTYVVEVEEQWISGPESVRYVVITEDGESRVDVMLLDYE